MAEPWFDPGTFGGLYGAIAGGGLGTLAGIGGGLAGSILVPRNMGRRWVLGAIIVFVLLGLAQIGFGLYALVSGQPFGIWYAPLLCGVICVVVPGGLFPLFRRLYAAAGAREA